MRIAIVRPDCNVLPRTFYNSQELGLATHLMSIGVSVDVFYAANTQKVEYEVIASDSDRGTVVRLIQLPFWEIPLIGMAYYPDLTAELQRSNYDLIQVNEYNDVINFFAVRYAKKNQIPVIVYQGMYKNLSGRVNGFYTKFHDKFVLPYLIKNVDHTISKTQRAAEFLKTKGFNQCDVLPVGLDPSPFNALQDSLTYSKDKLGIPSENKVIAYVGVFEPRRNIDFLLKLVKSLENQKVSFVFVGAGELFEQSLRVKQESNLTNLHILERIPQSLLQEIYELSDIFLLASDYEIYGMVLIEAMYNGLALISNKTAGSESLISSGDDGFIISELDISLWREQIIKLCQDEELLLSVQERARTKVREGLLWESIAQQYKSNVITKFTGV